MATTHLINLDSNNVKYQKTFEGLLFEMNIPFSSQSLNNGILYTVHFSSAFQFDEFKSKINKAAPYPIL